MTDRICVRGARVHNLRDVDVDVPLNRVVGIAGVSGSGKSSLALGVLYAEGSRRYLDSLSTYTRRRMTQSKRAQVDEVVHVPAALALHQRPAVPGIRSTFGTGTELLNTLRLMYSRLAEHRCPNGHMVGPSLAVAAGSDLVCPVCGTVVDVPSAEDLAFNGNGACPGCDGTGVSWTVDRGTLVPDESLTIDGGAVAPWKSLMWSLMTDVCREMGVRTDVPFRELTDAERSIVFDGPAVKKHILYKSKTSENAGELDFTYYSAVRTVENALSKVKDEKGMKRVERFLMRCTCPQCGGSRLSEAARAPRLRGIGLDAACAMSLSGLVEWVRGVPGSLPDAMVPMAESICGTFLENSGRLMELGLGYLSLDRASSTLSTGERQRMQLSRAVRNRTTGVLYVLDEPSIGLHPSNMTGLRGVIRDLVADGNSVVLVDHDTQLLSDTDWLIEMGPGAGTDGGRVVAQGTVADIVRDPSSIIGPYLAEDGRAGVTDDRRPDDPFAHGRLHISTGAIHTVGPLEVDIPLGRLTVVTGVSGSGKTTLVLESLVPALESLVSGTPLPEHVLSVEAAGISRVRLVDASPIGANVRSTVATFSGVHDDLRRMFARTDDARSSGLGAGDFSYNTGSLRCGTCDGTGEMCLDVQFLPDVVVPCPDCGGSRYGPVASAIRLGCPDGTFRTIPEVMGMEVRGALSVFGSKGGIGRRLSVLDELGLGYLALGEGTPGLSGGEAQRLKLAGDMGRGQSDTVFVFDEPTIGLHPRDVANLMGILRTLTSHGATVVVVEHDLDVIGGADWIVDMGPGGGEEGGRIVSTGRPGDVARDPGSVTGRYIRVTDTTT